MATTITPLQAMAQDDEAMLQVAEVKVKGSHIGEFIDLQREYAEAAREAGNRSRSVWQVVRGRTNTFHIVRTVDNYGYYDDPADQPISGADWGRWVTRIQATIDSRTLWNLEIHDDLVIPAPEDEAQNLVFLRIRTVKPFQNDEYEEWIRDKLLPGLRDGGATGVSFYRIRSGGDSNTWFGVTRHASWAELDGPGPLSGLSERQRNSMFGDAEELQTGGENLVLRYRADMSY
jgi:hypothetical protein